MSSYSDDFEDLRKPRRNHNNKKKKHSEYAEQDYIELSKTEIVHSYNRIKNKRMSSALKSKDVDALLHLEDE